MRENVLKINKVFQQYFLTQKILPILTVEELDSCNYLTDIFLENSYPLLITLLSNLLFLLFINSIERIIITNEKIINEICEAASKLFIPNQRLNIANVSVSTAK